MISPVGAAAVSPTYTGGANVFLGYGSGSYGYCEETGEPIGVARLIARPTATLSLEAQERRERMQKMYGE